MKTVEQGQLEILFRQSDRILLGSALIACTTGWVLWGSANKTWLGVWIFAMIFLTILRGIITYIIRKKHINNYQQYSQYFIIAGSLSGFTLGLAPFLIPPGFSFELAFIYIITIAMMAGAVSSISSYLPAFYGYFFSLYIPFSIRILTNAIVTFPEDKPMMGLSILFILTTPILIYFGRSINRWITSNLTALHEKQILATKLEADQEKLRLTDSALNNVNEGIIITNSEMEIIYSNEAFTRISGFTSAEVIGKPPQIFQSEEGNNFQWSLSENNGIWEGEVLNQRKNGRTYPALFNVVPMKDSLNNITNYIIHFKDITDTKNQENELRYFANFDHLTGLPNRKYIYDHLDALLNPNNTINFSGSLLFLDINYFKIINDLYGHQTGDLLLIEISKRLQDTIRADDTLGRLGGDEFIVILKNTSREETIKISEQLIQTINNPFNINGKKCNVGLSIGIAIIPDHGNDRRTLMHHADTAMYEAKLIKHDIHWVIYNEPARVKFPEQ